MKKALVLLLVLTALLSLTGCGSEAAPVEAAAPAVNSTTPEPTRDAEPVTAPVPTAAPEAAPAPTVIPKSEDAAQETADVDLTQLSSTMVYSEVYAMVYEPEQYIGKTVKMSGLFATQEYEGTRLFACIVQDATACCAQGMEFELAENCVYPDEYPQPGEEITVIGTFDTYTEDAGDGNYYIYLVLRNARLL